MPLAPLAPLAVVALVASGAELAYRKLFSRRARVKRALARRPDASAPHAEGASIRATGRVRATGGLLRAPLSGRPCVAYHLSVGIQSQRLWSILFELRGGRTFSVADESGSVVVDGAAPVIFALANEITGQAGWLGSNRERDTALFELIEAQGIPTRTLFGQRRTFWYSENALEEGKAVSVAGIGVHDVHPDGERPAPREVPERLVLCGTADDPLLISDDPAP